MLLVLGDISILLGSGVNSGDFLSCSDFSRFLTCLS